MTRSKPACVDQDIRVTWALISAWRDLGRVSAEIARGLADLGLPHPKGGAWTAARVVALCIEKGVVPNESWRDAAHEKRNREWRERASARGAAEEAERNLRLEQRAAVLQNGAARRDLQHARWHLGLLSERLEVAFGRVERQARRDRTKAIRDANQATRDARRASRTPAVLAAEAHAAERAAAAAAEKARAVRDRAAPVVLRMTVEGRSIRETGVELHRLGIESAHGGAWTKTKIAKLRALVR